MKQERFKLFGGDSIRLDSPAFRLDGKVAITALGLQAGDEIHFEILTLTEVQAGFYAGACCIGLVEQADIQMVEPMVCPACETETLQRVRLTQRNNFIVLDAPQGNFVRAIYEGTAIGSVEVYGITNATTGDLTPELRGCPPVCCEDEDQTWQENGNQRCNLDTDELERQFVSNCGNLEWRSVGAINWQDTGELQCDPDKTTTLKRQVNDCGDSRWIDGPAQIWQDAGDSRCAAGSQTAMEKRQTNQCGESRWVLDPSTEQEWEDDGEIKCTPGSQTATEKRQVNQCGSIRWVNGPAQVWEDTGEVRCVPGSQTATEKQQTNQCNQTRWVAGPAQVWSQTGQYQCSGLTPNGATYKLSAQERNQCDELRWGTPVDADWLDSGNYRPDPSAPEGVLKEQTTRCGDTRWVTGEAQSWVATGIERCREGVMQEQEQSPAGLLRWVNTGRPCVSPEYFATLPLPGCGGFAFRPSDTRDPAATVEIKGCGEAVEGYLYPAPREGASTPVTVDACTGNCGDETLLGYAVDRSSSSSAGGGCQQPINLDPRVKAVQLIEACGDNERPAILWDDGSITRVG